MSCSDKLAWVGRINTSNNEINIVKERGETNLNEEGLGSSYPSIVCQLLKTYTVEFRLLKALSHGK